MTETPRQPRVEIFVDGTNFRIAQHDAGIPEIDIPRFARQLARGYVLVKMRYYTSPLPRTQPDIYPKQQRFFERLRGTRAIELVLGRNEPRRENVRCPKCGEVTTLRHHVEKETDVNLAVDMAVGAHTDRYDVAMLCRGRYGLCSCDRGRAGHRAQGDLVPLPLAGTHRSPAPGL